MLDTSIYSDSPVSFDFSHPFKVKSKESFPFIFLDNMNYLRSLFNRNKMRSITFDHIQKTILCGSVYLGYDLFSCPTCGMESIIPHRCHSRFCTTCGAKESKVRAARISSMALDAHHRHIVFTIPEDLRILFLKDRNLLHLLFIAARNTLACLFNNEKFRKKKNKKKHSFYPNKKKSKSIYYYKNDRDRITFGAVMTLHTFGRDLKWNPHIHCLVCEEAYDRIKNKMKNFSFMSYEKLRKTWMYQVLELLSDKKIKGFDPLKAKNYRIHKDGFYVYAKKRENQKDDNIEECVSYITRYTSRPAMAQSRIISYEDDKKMIRWWYNRHEDEKYIEVYEDVHDFLHKLILHCPEENFKMVRYYGFYHQKNQDLLEQVYQLYGRKMKQKKPVKLTAQRKKELKDKLNQLKFRTHMIQSYGRDPILCRCGTLMQYEYSYDPFEGGTPNDRRYRERSIEEARSMGRRSRLCHYD